MKNWICAGDWYYSEHDTLDKALARRAELKFPARVWPTSKLERKFDAMARVSASASLQRDDLDKAKHETASDWPTAFATPAFRAFAERTARLDEAERLAEREDGWQ